ncbi:MAG: hypothetical protein ACRYG4_15615 [Janthinobacterium lividum]
MLRDVTHQATDTALLRRLLTRDQPTGAANRMLFTESIERAQELWVGSRQDAALRRRRNRDQDPLAEPSAAWTRWRIASASSERLGVAGVGRARWQVGVARQRGGEAFSMILEGCDETGCLAVPAALGHRTAETAGPARHAAACMNRAFNMLEADKGLRIGLADLQDDDPDVYAMISKADTLGIFQIESRARMSMLRV